MEPRGQQISPLKLQLIFVLFVICVLGSCSALQFVTQPESLTVTEGTNILLMCAVDQTDNVDFQWTLNNAPVQESDTMSVDSSNNLRLSSISQDLDEARFRCTVTDTQSSLTIVSEPAILNVTWIASEARVQLKSPSTLADVEEGVKVTLQCKVLGNPTPQVMWYRDQTRLLTTDNVDFTPNRIKIKSATAQDSGTYSCKASNSVGTTWSTAENVTLSIIDSNTPVIETAPEDALRLIGESVLFHCVFSGSPSPPIQWYFIRDGSTPRPLANDTATSTYIYNNGTLHMDNIMASDEGLYQCVCNSPYVTPEATARLSIATVQPLPPFDTMLVAENTMKTINCSYPEGETGGLPTPTIQWLKSSGKEITVDATKRVHTLDPGHALVFNPVKKQDEGNYTCRSSSTAGEETQVLRLVVATVPKITTKPQDTHVDETKEALLPCEATGTPTPTVRWYYGDSVDATNKRGVELMEDGTLHFRSAMLMHNGTYTCMATTVAGSKTASATLFVRAILKFNPKPVSKQLERGEEGRLVCHATASTTPFIRWVKVGHLGNWPPHVSSNVNGVLEFNPSMKSDAGKYLCIASTGTEMINASVTVEVYVKPKFNITPNNTIGFEGYSLRIDCSAYGEPMPTVTWFSKQINQNPDRFEQLGNGSLIIKEVLQSDAGRYQCIAGSDAGLNTTEVMLSVQKGTPPDTQPFTPQLMTRTIAIAVGCAAAYILLVVGLMLWCRQRRRRHRRKMKSLEKTNGAVGATTGMLNEYHDAEFPGKADGDIVMGPTPNKNHRGSYDKLQFPRHDMQTITVIGHGAYGEVSLCRAAGIKDGEEATTVMVKALQTKEESLQLDFRREIEMLSKVNHDNIVKLLGVCRDSDPQLMITEYLDWGDLKQFLQATRGENGTTNVPPPLTLSQKIDVINQVALGMEHLSNNRFIHGDLAARNCLLSPSMEVKICTMSVSQDLYRTEYHEYHQKLIPVRWMPAEAIFEDELSTKSDIWAYGIFVWEVFSQGQLPYTALDNDAVMRAMIDGELMLETPAETPDEVEIMMHRCWADSPKDRHSFADIVHILGRMSTDSRV